MDFNLYQSWMRHETENGFACGVSAALYGKPMMTDVRLNMPNNIADKMAPESWDKLVRARTEAYASGYQSVTTFTVRSASKKEAESESASLKRRGYSVLGVQKLGRFEFVITAATEKRNNVPYGAKVI